MREEAKAKAMARFVETIKSFADPAECWEWPAWQDSRGYGVIKMKDGSKVYGFVAHRLSYENANGLAPGVLCVCHACDNPACVNPAHLWLGTRGDNARDREAKKRGHNSKKTHCLRGHPFDDENTLRSPIGERFCRACARIRSRRTQEKKKAAQKATGLNRDAWPLRVNDRREDRSYSCPREPSRNLRCVSALTGFGQG